MPGTASWTGIEMTMGGGFRYLPTHGTTPGTGSMGCAEDSAPPKNASAEFSDGAISYTLPDCLMTNYLPPQGGSTGVITFVDRRWRWQYARPVTIHYNKRERQGEFPKVPKTAGLIALEAFDALDELNANVDGLPGNVSDNWGLPELKYLAANPTAILDDLCSRYNCVLVYDIRTDTVAIIDQAAALTDLNQFNDIKQPEFSEAGLVIPSSVAVAGGNNIIESEVTDLVPVKIGPDGVVSDLDDTDGAWFESMLNRFGDRVQNEAFEPVTEDDIERWERCVYRWFRLPDTVHGFDRFDVQPLLSEINAVKLDGGVLVRDVPYVRGPQYDLNTRHKTIKRIEGGWSIDLRAGILKFDSPRYSLDASEITKPIPPDMTQYFLRIAFSDPTESYESASTTVTNANSIVTEWLKNETLTIRFIDGFDQNLAEIDDYAASMIATRIEEYGRTISGTGTNVGFQNHDPAPNLAVEYSIGQGGAVMNLGLDVPANSRVMKSDYKEVLRIEASKRSDNQTTMHKREAVEADTVRGGQNVKAGSVAPETPAGYKPMGDTQGAVPALNTGSTTIGRVCIMDTSIVDGYLDGKLLVRAIDSVDDETFPLLINTNGVNIPPDGELMVKPLRGDWYPVKTESSVLANTMIGAENGSDAMVADRPGLLAIATLDDTTALGLQQSMPPLFIRAKSAPSGGKVTVCLLGVDGTEATNTFIAFTGA